jgi:hypothetical protein
MKRFIQTLQVIFFLSLTSFVAKGQTVTIIASSDTVCVGSTVTLTNTNNFGANSFIWGNPGSLTPVYTSSQTVVLNTIGVSTFTLQAVALSNGDYAYTTKSIVVGGPSNYTYAASICSGSTFAFNGQNLSTAGTYKDTFQNVYGCDSVVTLNLTVNSLPFMPTAIAISSTICQGDTTLLKALPNVYTYCQLAPNPTGGDYIANVTLGGINNTTTYPGAIGYTLFPKTASTTTTLTAGTTYTISVKAGTYFNNYIAAWIDFDNDGVFASSEKIAQSGNLGANGIYTVAFTVPAGAINGDTRMRVFENNNNTNIFPCINSTYGEAEDYAVTISGGANQPTISWTPIAIASTPNADSTLVFPTATTIYTVTTTDDNGCTNTASVNIAVNMPSSFIITDTICANTPYTFNGQSITATGTYYDTLVNAIGCDSIITLNLYAKPISNYAYADTICAGTIYTFNGQSLTATGAYYDTLVNAVGCDSIVTLNLTVNSLPIMPSVVATSSTICQGDTTLLKVQPTAPYCLLSPYSQDGDYVANVTLGSINNTTTNPSSGGYTLFAPTATTSTTLTAGSTYTISLTVGYYLDSWFGPVNCIAAWIDFNNDGVFDTSEKIAQSGFLGANDVYTATFTVPSGAINGTTRMRVFEDNQNLNMNLNISPCVSFYGVGEVEDYTVTITGGVTPMTFAWAPSTSVSTPNADSTLAFPTSNTTYTVTGTDLNGCTNTATVNITVNIPSSSTITDTICSGNVYAFGGQSLSASGTYYDTLVNALGCDSVVTLNLTVSSPSTYTYADTICAGTTYSFNGQNLTDSGTYYDTLVTAGGCDSFVTLNLVVKQEPFVNATVSNDTLCVGGLVNLYATNKFLGFVGPFNPANGTYYTTGNFTTGGFYFSNVPNSVTMVSSDDGSNSTGSSYWVSDTIKQSGAINFNWHYNTGDAANQDYVRYKINGGIFQHLNGYNSITGTIQNGTQSIAVNEGDVITFEIFTIDNSYGPCTVTLNNFVFTPSITSTYLWTGNGIANPANDTTLATLSTSGLQTFMVTGTAANGCSSVDSVKVMVNALPMVNAIASNDTLCQGNMVNLTESTPAPSPVLGFVGPFAYANGSVSSNSYFVNGIFDFTNPTGTVDMVTSTTAGANAAISEWTSGIIPQNGVISFHASTIGNASHQTSFRINGGSPTFLFFVPPPPGPPSTIPYNIANTFTVAVNAGDRITFRLYAYNTALRCTTSVSNFKFTPTTTYLWTGNGITNANAKNTSALLNTAGLQPYTVQVTNSFGCSNTDSVNVLVNALPSITATASDDTVCQGNAIQLSANNTNNYVINGFVGPFADSNVTTSINASYNYTGVSILRLFVPTLIDEPGPATSDYLTTDTFTQAGTINFNWSYINSFTSPSNAYVRYTINNSVFSFFSGFLTTGNNIQNGSQTITVNAGDVITFEMYSDGTVTYHGSIITLSNLTFTPTTPVTFAWAGNSLSNPTNVTANAVLNIPGTQTYTVTGTDFYGCSNTATVDVYANASSAHLAAMTSSQMQSQGDGTQITYTNTNCDVIAGVADATSGNLLGNTISTVTIDATAQTHNTQPYCRRHYDITPANQGAAVVTLYATLADFIDYNTTALANGWPLLPNDVNDTSGYIPNVRVTQVHGTGGLGTGVAELITPTSVTWNNTLNAWQITVPVDSFSSFFIHTGVAAPLSISTLDFYGKVVNDADLLHWTTASETNNDYFELFYSKDEINYTKIATVNSKAMNGNSATPLDYSMTNSNTVLGNNYYQLKMVDKTGKASFSKTIKLYHQPTENVVSVSPNPFTNKLSISIDALQKDDAAITVMDATGKLIQKLNATIEQGKNKINLDASNWASGIYFVHVKDSQSAINIIKVTKL